MERAVRFVVNHRARQAGLALAVFAAVGSAAACSSTSSYSSSIDGQAASLDSVVGPDVTVSAQGKALASGADDVQPGAPLVVNADAGRLMNVQVTSGSGGHVKGAYSNNGKTWTSSEPFGYGKQYTVNAQASGVGGSASLKPINFTTTEPNGVIDAALMPDAQADPVVGIAQPVVVKFDTPIPNKTLAQSLIHITTNPPVEGAFYWLSDSEVHWRPQNFWAPGTKVHVDLKTYGHDLGGGYYGAEDQHTDFTIGRSLIFTADDDTHTITVAQDGKVIRTMPTSMGEHTASNVTPNGTYIIGNRQDSIVMDSSTYGRPVDGPGGYKETVYHDTQMSYSGIYMHYAPWSIGSQGSEDVSNGCLNLNYDNATWVQHNTLRGDPVIVKNTPGPVLPGTDGLGDWNTPWNVWKAGNANT
jgi:lipoprotein-anchoring transpeptidase ErfK/SrfK